VESIDDLLSLLPLSGLDRFIVHTASYFQSKRYSSNPPFRFRNSRATPRRNSDLQLYQPPNPGGQASCQKGPSVRGAKGLVTLLPSRNERKSELGKRKFLTKHNAGLSEIGWDVLHAGCDCFNTAWSEIGRSPGRQSSLITFDLRAPRH